MGENTYPAPTVAFKWQKRVNTGQEQDIDGAESQAYTFTVEDVSDDEDTVEVRAGVKWTNSEGDTGWVFTDWVAFPSLPDVPDGTIIDTEFKEDFQLIYHDELEAMSGQIDRPPVAPTPVEYYPAETFSVHFEGTNRGCVLARKAGARPQLTIPLSRHAVPGQSYAINAQRVMALSQYINGRAFIATGQAGPSHLEVICDSSVIWSSVLPAENTPAAYDDEDIFEVPLESTGALSIVVRTQSGQGGASGGAPILTKLSIKAVEG